MSPRSKLLMMNQLLIQMMGEEPQNEQFLKKKSCRRSIVSGIREEFGDSMPREASVIIYQGKLISLEHVRFVIW